MVIYVTIYLIKYTWDSIFEKYGVWLLEKEDVM